MNKPVFKNILLVLGSLAVSIILLEIVLTFADYPPEKPFLQEFYGPDFKLMCYDMPPSSGYDIDLRNDAARAPYERIFEKSGNAAFFLCWKYTPYAVRIAYNSRGFREKEFAPKMPGKRRIVMIGDSFTYGHGLNNAYSYPRIIEKLLKEKCGDDSCEVLNLGGGGVGMEWVYNAVPEIIKELHPDILIYGYFFNDPVEGDSAGNRQDVPGMSGQNRLKIERTMTYFPLGMRERTRPYLLDTIRYLLKSIALTRETLKRYQEINSPVKWEPTGKMMEAVNLSSAQGNCRFIVVLLPVIYKISESPLAGTHQYLDATLRQRGIEVIDCLPALSKFDDEDLFLHPRDRHPNALYHRTVAETIIEKAGLCLQKVKHAPQ
jgi:hypothetical protein